MENDILYEIVEVYEGETYIRLSSRKPKESDGYTFRAVGVGDVTLTDLIYYIESDLENANYHSMTALPAIIADAIKKHSDEETAKRVLWDIKGKFMR